MKSYSFKTLIVLFLSVMTATIISCSSDDSSGGGQTGKGFFYGENGTTTLTKADDSWVNGNYNSIIAQNGGNTVVEIVLPDLAEGIYDLSAQYAFTYIKNSSFWEASAGTLTITKNDGSKLSGTYEATAGSGVSGVNSVKGEFNDIPIN